MTIHSLETMQGHCFIIECPCGFQTGRHFTLEAAGRAADLHMAEKFPTPTQRRPCEFPPWPVGEALELEER
jgi:hypothetical protein